MGPLLCRSVLPVARTTWGGWGYAAVALTGSVSFHAIVSYFRSQ
jgi:hypothetical protein